MKKIICILACLHICILLSAQNVAVTAFVNNEVLRHANISFQMRDLSNNKVVAEYNAQKSCTPASVTKVITTATALELLGADYRFQTNILANEYISDSIFYGDLIINGTGDPTLGSRYFSNSDFVPAWIEAVRKMGVKKIAGFIKINTDLYDDNPIPVLWLREDAGNYYGAGVFPVSVFDNTISVKINSFSEPEIVETTPNINYTFHNCLKIGTKDSIYFSGEPFSDERTVYGTIRPNTIRTEKCDISNPPQFLAKYFSEKLKENGIEVEENAVDILPDHKFVTIHSHFSPELSKIAAMTNTFSNNNYAEHLLKRLALQKDSVASFNTALQVVHEFWTKKGVDVSGLFMYDGSGLSPKNAVSATFICDVLTYMKGNAAFYNSLPIAGESGTVTSFLAGTALKGKARVKSGSFRNVQCYAGYITRNGKEYAFCVLVNNFTGERKNVVKLIEELLVNSTL